MVGKKMAVPEFVPFAAYTRDRSNSVGFRFEFICGRCGNGYMNSYRCRFSPWARASHRWRASTVSSAL